MRGADLGYSLGCAGGLAFVIPLLRSYWWFPDSSTASIPKTGSEAEDGCSAAGQVLFLA